jgi:hypothetical protein
LVVGKRLQAAHLVAGARVETGKEITGIGKCETVTGAARETHSRSIGLHQIALLFAQVS